MYLCLLVPNGLALCEVLPSLFSILLLHRIMLRPPSTVLSTQAVNVSKATGTEVQYQLMDSWCWMRLGWVCASPLHLLPVLLSAGWGGELLRLLWGGSSSALPSWRVVILRHYVCLTFSLPSRLSMSLNLSHSAPHPCRNRRDG